MANRTNHSKQYIDITGKKFHKLTVINYAFTKNWKAYWNCLCDCGKEKIVAGTKLRTRTKSCGSCKPKKIKVPKPKLVKDERYWITKWVKRNLLRKSDRANFLSRRKLNIEQVVELAIIGKQKFPYMSFVANCNKAFYASIDKINHNKDYSDIYNIQIIPLWLNAAKMQLTEDELKKLMKEYLCL